jgi:hypothetical protein
MSDHVARELIEQLQDNVLELVKDTNRLIELINKLEKRISLLEAKQ